MTAILGLLLSLSLLSSPVTKAGNQNLDNKAQIERIATDESTFTVQNSTTVNVGLVKILNTANLQIGQINVTGAGTFSTSLTGTAVAATINGQICTFGVPVWIKINDHLAVRATLTTNIIVIDQQVVL